MPRKKDHMLRLIWSTAQPESNHHTGVFIQMNPDTESHSHGSQMDYKNWIYNVLCKDMWRNGMTGITTRFIDGYVSSTNVDITLAFRVGCCAVLATAIDIETDSTGFLQFGCAVMDARCDIHWQQPTDFTAKTMMKNKDFSRTTQEHYNEILEVLDSRDSLKPKKFEWRSQRWSHSRMV